LFIFDRVYSKVAKAHIRSKVAELGDGSFTLDLACGNSPMREAFPNRIGCDIVCNSNVDVVANAHCLPFNDAYFETVLCNEALEHFIDPHKAVSEMARVLKEGGKLILTCPFCYPVHEAPHDYQRFTEYGLRVLFEPYFHSITIEPLFNELQTMAIIFQRIAFQKDMSKLAKWIVHALSHLIYNLGKSRLNFKGKPHQRIGGGYPGCFLTATYLLVAYKNSKLMMSTNC